MYRLWTGLAVGLGLIAVLFGGITGGSLPTRATLVAEPPLSTSDWEAGDPAGLADAEALADYHAQLRREAEAEGFVPLEDRP